MSAKIELGWVRRGDAALRMRTDDVRVSRVSVAGLVRAGLLLPVSVGGGRGDRGVNGGADDRLVRPAGTRRSLPSNASAGDEAWASESDAPSPTGRLATRRTWSTSPRMCLLPKSYGLDGR
jgi:hypothetical protein